MSRLNKLPAKFVALNKLARECHKTALSKGWWSTERDGVPEKLLLCHSEISEAVEMLREEPRAGKVWASPLGGLEGFPVELADLMIRVLDLCGRLRINIGRVVQMKMDYNSRRPFRHGNKQF